MSWFPESIVDYAPSGSELGLIVRPIGAGPNGATQVEIVKGTLTVGSASFTSATIVRDATDTNWVNVGVGAESAITLHMPVRIQGTGSAVVEPLSSTPIGSEVALPIRQVGIASVSGTVELTGPITGSVKLTEAASVIFPNKVSTLNSTTTLLTASQIWTGVWEDVTTYGAIGCSVYSDVSSSIDGWNFQWSSNGVDVDIDDPKNVYALTGSHSHCDIQGRYFRVHYINGSAAQSIFRLQTIFHAGASNVHENRVEDLPVNGDTAAVTQAIIVGKNPGREAFTAVATTADGALRTYSTNVDAFGRLLVAFPATLFESKMLIDSGTLYWSDARLSGSGTTSVYNIDQASVTMTVASGTAGFHARQTYQRFAYQPGKSQLAVFTGILGTPQAGITRRIGLFGSHNGLFFESSPTAVNLVVRSMTSGTPVDIKIPQSQWNIDKLDGTGKSGINLDFSKTQIMAVQFQWLGVGSVWYAFDINGDMVFCHRVDHANTLNKVYMSTPNLPVRYDIENDGTGLEASVTQICAAVISEGGVQETGTTRVVLRDTPFAAANDTNWYPLVAMRFKAGTTYNRAIVSLKKITLSCGTTAQFAWKIILNPTIAGPALTFTSLPNSAIEYDVSRTNTTTVVAGSGTDIDGGIEQQTNQVSTISIGATNVRMGSDINDVKDIWVLAVKKIVGAAEDYSASITFLEQT